MLSHAPDNRFASDQTAPDESASLTLFSSVTCNRSLHAGLLTWTLPS